MSFNNLPFFKLKSIKTFYKLHNLNLCSFKRWGCEANHLRKSTQTVLNNWLRFINWSVRTTRFLYELLIMDAPCGYERLLLDSDNWWVIIKCHGDRRSAALCRLQQVPTNPLMNNWSLINYAFCIWCNSKNNIKYCVTKITVTNSHKEI